MFFLKSCLLVAALIQTTTAFHPFVPDYRCADFNTCSSTKRAVEGEPNGGAPGLALEIFQPIPKSTLPHDVQIQRLAARLSHKYQRGTRTTSSIRKEEPFEKRVNNYKIVSAAIPTTTASVGIDQDGTDFSYFVRVLLGSKRTPMNMLLDTGAGTTWVMGHACKSDPCKSHNNFGGEDSDTFKPSTVEFELHYGSGNVSGLMATDSLTVAGITIQPTFGIATVTSDDFNNFPIDGILGLAQSKGPHDTFIETLLAAKALTANMFGVSISRSSDGPNTGVLNFGAPDTSQFTGSLSYVAVHGTDKEDWVIPMDEVSFDGKKAGIQFKLAYVDTGTSYIFTQKDEVKRLHDVIPGATSSDGITWRVPCTTTKDLQFTFGGATFAISAKDWVGPEVDGQCTSNIYGHDVVGDAWLLGDTFLKNVYAVFDIDGNRIGFAPKKAPPPVVTSSSSATGGTSPSSSGPVETGSSGGTVDPSNALSTGPLATQTSTVEPPGSQSTGSVGMSGQETNSKTTVAQAAESSATPSTTLTGNKSGAKRIDNSLTSAVLVILGLVPLIT